jgi:hypothetical protein
VRGDFDSLSEDARGKLKWRARSRGNRQILKIDAKVRFGTEINESNADQGVVYAVFPDGTVCELERSIRGSDVRYRLDSRERDGVLDQKRGTCAPSIVPSVTGGSVDILNDHDDDPDSPDTTLLTGNF